MLIGIDDVYLLLVCVPEGIKYRYRHWGHMGCAVERVNKFIFGNISSVHQSNLTSS